MLDPHQGLIRRQLERWRLHTEADTAAVALRTTLHEDHSRQLQEAATERDAIATRLEDAVQAAEIARQQALEQKSLAEAEARERQAQSQAAYDAMSHEL